MKIEKPDELFMRRALRLAAKGAGRVSPNPMVGALIVKEGVIISEGWHERFGGPHAEVVALEKALSPVEGSTLYVTLEPCSHYGKTPPCAERIAAAGFARVVIGVMDPNPLVAGRGIRALQDKGIKTEVGVLEKECAALNEKFFKFMTAGLPYVTLKMALTLDGRIATASGDSRWITSVLSRREAHRERALHDGVMVGIGTILQDDPELTVRLVRGRNPLRIVVDSSLRIPLGAKVLRDQPKAKTLIACSSSRDQEKYEKLREMGIELITSGTGPVALPGLLAELGERGISSIMVEGGAGLYTAFLRENLADRVLAFIAPLITGKGIEAVGDLGTERIADSRRLVIRKVSRRGGDVVVDSRIK